RVELRALAGAGRHANGARLRLVIGRLADVAGAAFIVLVRFTEVVSPTPVIVVAFEFRRRRLLRLLGRGVGTTRSESRERDDDETGPVLRGFVHAAARARTRPPSRATARQKTPTNRRSDRRDHVRNDTNGAVVGPYSRSTTSCAGRLVRPEKS